MKTFPGMDGAVKWLREQNLVDDLGLAEADTRARQAAGEASRQSVEALNKRLIEAVEESVRLGEDEKQFQARLRAILTISRRQERSIYRTYTHRMMTQGQASMLSSPSMQARFPFRKFSTSDDDRVRPEHAEMDGKIYRVGTEDHRKAQRLLHEWGCRCTEIPLTEKDAIAQGYEVPGTQQSLELSQRHVTPFYRVIVTKTPLGTIYRLAKYQWTTLDGRQTTGYRLPAHAKKSGKFEVIKEDRKAKPVPGGKLTTTQQKLAADNLGLVGSVVKKYAGAGKYDRDDLFSVGQEALVKAAGLFDAKKGAKFSTFATDVVNKAIMTHLSKKREQPLGEEQEAAVLARQETPTFDAEQLANTLRQLDPMEQELIRRRFKVGGGAADAAASAAIAKMSPATVTRRTQAALARMRTLMEGGTAPKTASRDAKPVKAPKPVEQKPKKPWEMTRDDWAHSQGAPKPEIDLLSESSAHQRSMMSDRAKSDMFRRNSEKRREATTKYDAAVDKWADAIITSAAAGEFDLANLFDTDAGDYVIDAASKAGIDVPSPFKLRQMDDETRRQILRSVQSQITSNLSTVRKALKPKEDWEMSKQEHWAKRFPGTDYGRLHSASNESAIAASSHIKSHRAAVKNALAAGKPVPPEVLADYPDLAPASRDAAPKVKSAPAETKNKPEVKKMTKPKPAEIPESDLWDSMRRGYQKQYRQSYRVGGIVVVPELVDQMLEENPGLTAEKARQKLKQWHDDGKIVLQENGANIYVENKHLVDVPVRSRSPELQQKASKTWNALLDVHDAVQSATKTGVVTVPELVDAIRQKTPEISAKEVRDLLVQFADDQKLYLQINNDPYLDKRASEGIQTPRGLLSYVILRDRTPAETKNKPEVKKMTKPKTAAKPAEIKAIFPPKDAGTAAKINAAAEDAAKALTVQQFKDWAKEIGLTLTGSKKAMLDQFKNSVDRLAVSAVQSDWQKWK